MILPCEYTLPTIPKYKLSFLKITNSNLTISICVAPCRLGGVIAAYKIVPDEIDDIKVVAFFWFIGCCPFTQEIFNIFWIILENFGPDIFWIFPEHVNFTEGGYQSWICFHHLKYPGVGGGGCSCLSSRWSSRNSDSMWVIHSTCIGMLPQDKHIRINNMHATYNLGEWLRVDRDRETRKYEGALRHCMSFI